MRVHAWLQPILFMATFAFAGSISADEKESLETPKRIADVKSAKDLNRQVQRSVGTTYDVLPEGHTLKIELFDMVFGLGRIPDCTKRVFVVDAQGRMDGIECVFSERSGDALMLQRITWKAGERDGEEQAFDTRGSLLRSVMWKAGKQEGEMKTFFPNGAVRTVCVMRDGKVEGPMKTYAADGKLLQQCTMKAGRMDGEAIDFFPETGKPSRIRPYRNGVVDGVVKEFHPDGILRREVPFVNDRAHGIEKCYNTAGVLEKTLYWLDGDTCDKDTYEAAAKKK